MQRISGWKAVAFVVLSWMALTQRTLCAEEFGIWEEGSQKTASAPGTEAKKKGPAPEELQRQVEAMMGPMMGLMMGEMIKGMARTFADPEISQSFAAFSRNYYLALVERGFTEEEAMRIVASTGIPSLAGKQ